MGKSLDWDGADRNVAVRVTGADPAEVSYIRDVSDRIGIENPTNIVVGASMAVGGSSVWLYFFFGGVTVTPETIRVRWFRTHTVPLAEVAAILVDKEFSSPVLATRDGKRVRLAPLVGPLAIYGLGARKTERVVRRLADAINVPVRRLD